MPAGFTASGAKVDAVFGRGVARLATLSGSDFRDFRLHCAQLLFQRTTQFAAQGDETDRTRITRVWQEIVEPEGERPRRLRQHEDAVGETNGLLDGARGDRN